MENEFSDEEPTKPMVEDDVWAKSDGWLVGPLRPTRDMRPLRRRAVIDVSDGIPCALGTGECPDVSDGVPTVVGGEPTEPVRFIEI